MGNDTQSARRGGVTTDALIQFVLNNKALLILVVLVIASSFLAQEKFMNLSNLTSVTRQIVMIAMLGIGFTVVLASGGVDLSVGHMLSFTGVAYALMSTRMPLPFAILLTLVLGALCGLLNGVISEKLNLVPFIVTLATAQIFRGFASLLSDGKSISGLSDGVKYLGQGSVFEVIPVSLIITVVLAIVMAIVLYKMRYGRHVIVCNF